jgi:hypothetical protein
MFENVECLRRTLTNESEVNETRKKKSQRGHDYTVHLKNYLPVCLPEC